MSRILSILLLSATICATALHLIALLAPSITEIQLNRSYLAAAFLVSLGSWIANGARLSLLTKNTETPMPFNTCLLLFIAAECASRLSPGETGAIPVYYRHLQKTGAKPAKSIAIIGFGGLLDAAAIGLMLVCVSTSWQPLSPSLIAFAALLLAGRVLARRRRRHPAKPLQTGRAMRFHRFLREVSRYASSYRPTQLIGLLALSTVFWCCRHLTFWLCALGVGLQLSWQEGLLGGLIAQAAGAATLLPLGGGAAEAAALIYLSQPGVETALWAVLAWRILACYQFIVVGPLAIYYLRHSTSPVEPDMISGA